MSTANTQIAQNCYAAFGRGDIAAILDALSDDIVWTTPDPTLPTGGVRRGKAQVAEFFQTVGRTWEFKAFEPKEFIASGDALVVLGSYTLSGRSTGKTVTAQWAMAWKFSGGKVTSFQEYTDSGSLRDGLSAGAGA